MQRPRGVRESRQDGELGGLVWLGRMVFVEERTAGQDGVCGGEDSRLDTDWD